MEKRFKTLDEQIDILKSKGLIIEDEEEAKDILLRENYFFVTGYRHLFINPMSKKEYIVNASFKEMYSLFCFDRELRSILFKNLLMIENNLKSVIAYQLSKKYGYKEKDYLNPKNFSRDHGKARRVRDVIDKMKRQIRVNGSHHNATMHYIFNYGYIPLWILVKVLSFGIVCELYSILRQEDKVEIADMFGVGTKQLDEYLPILSNYRNLCAHEDIVYENRTEKYINDTIYHDKMGIDRVNGEYIYGKNDIFSLIIILKYLLKKDNFRKMVKEIEYEIELLDSRIDSIPIDKVLDRMGMPDNYIEIIDL